MVVRDLFFIRWHRGADQYVMGERVLAAGVVLRLVPAEVNPLSVRASVRALLEESSYRWRSSLAARDRSNAGTRASGASDRGGCGGCGLSLRTSSWGWRKELAPW